MMRIDELCGGFAFSAIGRGALSAFQADSEVVLPLDLPSGIHEVGSLCLDEDISIGFAVGGYDFGTVVADNMVYVFVGADFHRAYQALDFAVCVFGLGGCVHLDLS